jgi:xanthine dehydrogenase accessory factor
MHSRSRSEDIDRALVELADQGRDCALAVVLETDGSTPCKVGSKAIVDGEGVLHGTIGGGLVEAETQRRAAEAISAGRPVVLDFSLDNRDGAGDEPICGGAMRVLLDPAAVRRRAAYASASDTRRRRQRGVMLTSVRVGQEWEVAVEFLVEEAIPADLEVPSAEAVRLAIQREEPRLFVAESTPEAQRLEVLIEPIVPAPVLLIVGGGHVGQAVAAQADLVGFEIVVVDDRPEFTRGELFPAGTTARRGGIGKEITDFPIDGDTYVVIVTRGHRHDADALAACIHRPAAYIGMIGSRRKVAVMREAFVDSGEATSAEFDRVYAPIGLNIGSVTVPEIAAGVVAQLVAVRRRGTSPRMPAREP